MATANGSHPPIEGIIPHSTASNVSSDKNTPPSGPFTTTSQVGFTSPQGSYGNQQGDFGPSLQGSHGPPGPGGYGPPPQGSYGQPPVNYGPAGAPGIGAQGIYGPPQAAHGPPPSNYQGGPVINQPPPGGHAWMNMPQNAVPNCPPGLEYLTLIDQLIVHQEVELLEVVTKFETENKFTIHNSLGQKVYSAFESSDACMRNCCGSFRPFELKILDNFGKPIIHLNRPFACQGCCCPCFLQKMEVSSPPGTLVGTIEQEWSFWVPKFAIKNANGDVVLKISGPYCTMACCGDVDFQVLTSDGSNKVGKISKKWSGYAKENYTDADNFGINFPMDLDVRMKAVMLGACFLIDMMYYERRGNQNATTNRNDSTTAGTTATTTTNNRV